MAVVKKHVFSNLNFKANHDNASVKECIFYNADTGEIDYWEDKIAGRPVGRYYRPLVDIIDHWSIIDHFAKMVDILEFVVDITLKWSIFYQKISQSGDMIYLRT